MRLAQEQHQLCKRAQEAAFSSAVTGLGFTRTPLMYVTPAATSASSSGAATYPRKIDARRAT